MPAGAGISAELHAEIQSRGLSSPDAGRRRHDGWFPPRPGRPAQLILSIYFGIFSSRLRSLRAARFLAT